MLSAIDKQICELIKYDRLLSFCRLEQSPVLLFALRTVVSSVLL